MLDGRLGLADLGGPTLHNVYGSPAKRPRAHATRVLAIEAQSEMRLLARPRGRSTFAEAGAEGCTVHVVALVWLWLG